MPTHFLGSPDEIRALNAYIRLTRAVEVLSARLFSSDQLDGLTTSQLGVLDALFYRGPMHQKALARKLLKSSGNLTLVIDNLEKRGLVCRERQGKDRRFVTIQLTEDGEALIKRVMPLHVAEVQKAFLALSPEEQEMLGDLCKKLGLSL